MICNPQEAEGKAKKDGKELEDKSEFPSLYVGESGRSLHERAQERWNDFNGRKNDSHILKHWLTHHHGQGIPKFKIRVIQYCRDTLTRQVGEAVRINYRGQTLNSKSGYNRSGLSRLVVEERDEETQEEIQEIECPDPRGLKNLHGDGKLAPRDVKKT